MGGRKHISYAAIEDGLDRVDSGNSDQSPGQQGLRQRFWSLLNSWRGTTLTGLIVTLLVLVLNLTLLIWAKTTKQRDPISGTYIIASSECSNNSSLSTLIHLIINLLSSLLLGASNHCMQVIGSPTRKDIDEAHRNGRWLSIGVFSPRNLRSIPAQRSLICCLLAISSIPLALIYNSVVVDILSTNSWVGFWVDDSVFTNGPHIPIDSCIAHVDPTTLSPMRGPSDSCGCAPASVYSSDCALPYISIFQNEHGMLKSDLVNLTSMSCEKIYIRDIVNRYRNVLYVTKKGSQLWELLRNDFSVQITQDNSSEWNVFNYTHSQSEDLLPDYCMAQKSKLPCQVGMSFPIMVIIIICNAIKALCLLYALLSLSFEPLVTLGDALDSFLASSDPYTKGESSLSEKDARKDWWPWGTQSQTLCGRAWRAESRLWMSCPSKRRLLLANVIGVGMWLTAFVILTPFGPNLGGLKISNFGAVGASDDGESNVFRLHFVHLFGNMTNAVVTNSPQLFISLMYLLLNGIITTMCLVGEYSTYSVKRQGLRVSKPRACQRESYFLSLPYRYSVPLILVMLLLHWLVSQSLFPLSIMAYDINGIPIPLSNDGDVLDDQHSDFNAFGVSALGIVISLVIGGLVLIAVPVLGARRLPCGFIIAGNCSAALSAACHPPTPTEGSDIDIAGQKLKYGVLPDDAPVDPDAEFRIRRVGFSAGEVEPLRDGDIYEAPRGALDILTTQDMPAYQHTEENEHLLSLRLPDQSYQGPGSLGALMTDIQNIR